MQKLLGINTNYKTIKNQKVGVLTGILYMAPYNLSGKNVCPAASKGCAAACLNTAGRGAMNVVQAARLKKTRRFFSNRNIFLFQLCDEIEDLKERAAKKGMKASVRLNGTSDLPWFKYKVDGGGSLMDIHPDVTFYDYTKVLNYLDHGKKNYHVTFSDSGTNYQDQVKAMTDYYANVAVVFKDKLPSTWMSRKVINGDAHDLRFKDPRGVIVGLVAKGLGKKVTKNSFIKIAS